MSQLTDDRILVGRLPHQPDQIEADKVYTVAGWVQSRRNHGQLIFVDLRDQTGILQLVFLPDSPDFKLAVNLKDESSFMVTGRLVARPPELVNLDLKTGRIELVVDKLLIFNQARALPIPLTAGSGTVHEDNRLRYRYLDLRRAVNQKMLQRRDQFYRLIRQFMQAHDFTEVPTPILANSSPEGARDFLVPSRLHPGLVYALPQAPQQFKQLLMVGGLSRYYQIAPCFRDEDPRADRLYGDFYQLDLEMSFVDDGAFVRRSLNPLIEQLIGPEFADKQLTGGTITSLSYHQALASYGSDKPDLRFGLELVDLTDIFKKLKSQLIDQALAESGLVKGLVLSAVVSRSRLNQLTDLATGAGLTGLGYLIATEAGLTGPLARLFKPALERELKDRLDLKAGSSLIFLAGPEADINPVLADLRGRLADWFKLIEPNQVAAVWVTDFPFYQVNDDGQLDFGHNPFSRPKTDPAQSDPATVVADQYDLVCNGYEVCSGAVRNYQPETLIAAFKAVGYDPELVKDRFRGLFEAFSYGAPPHAGCAFGLDRLLMILTDAANIRQVVAFPKTGRGLDLVFNSPSPVTGADLAGLGLSLKKSIKDQKQKP